MHELQLLEDIYTVSKLNREARLLLDGSFPLLWLEGEISNFRPRSSAGHLYFDLKDAKAQISCAMFKTRNQKLDFIPKDGTQVLVRGKVGLYEERGSYQFIIEYMEEAGDGVLRRAFEALKKRLAEEGLFDLHVKQALPAIPKCIGIVTSPTGAAIRDILSVLKRRFSNIPLIIYPTLVQGAEAATQITRAIQWANQRRECDVLILTRGGGSLEDLWPFNEEIVARAIFASEIPIISGVGHEIDFTIADFVADHRAPTPSAAAELVSPDAAEYYRALTQLMARIKHLMQVHLRHAHMALTHVTKRLQHPGKRLQDYAQSLDLLEQRFNVSMQHLLYQKQQQLANLSRALDAISPLNTLSRGYAIVSHNKHIVYSIENLQAGNSVDVRLVDGFLQCEVKTIGDKPCE